MKFEVRKSKILRNLFIAVTFLLVGQIIAIYLRLNTSGLNEKIPRLIIKLFNFDMEANLPTYFSSLILLGDGILLALIGCRYKTLGKKHLHWLGLSFVFVFLALDEMIQIHEQLRAPMAKLFNTTGILYYAWFIPYLIIVAILGIAYFKFMMRLPKHILKLFILAGFLFIFGAVVMEAISGLYEVKYGESDTLAYYVMTTFEELLEMSGAIIFFYALLYYITDNFKNFELKFVKT